MAPAHETHGLTEPSPWVARFAHLVPAGARLLDLACGHGRHARLFAGRGVHVVAVDRDAQAIASLDGVERIEARTVELEAGPWPLAGERFDAIVVVNYLHRPLLPLLLDSLDERGSLIYETFARGNEAYGRPANPAFLLARDELLDWVRGRLNVVAFEQGASAGAERDSVVQRIAAVGSARTGAQALDARQRPAASSDRMR